MPTKFYAVKKGRKPGIYEKWEDCKAQVSNFPGAEYKSFKTKPEATAYLKGAKPPQSPSSSPNTPLPTDPTTAVAYVDGSYDNESKRFSYGCIIFHKNEKKTLSNAYSDPVAGTMHNVAGEIMGALTAMKWCVTNNVQNLHLYYDYAGIEKWCTGEWQTKSPHTKKYKEIYDRYVTKHALKVTFHKVKGHSGDKYNNEADRLARQALKQ